MLVYHFWLQLVRFLISVIHMDKKSQGIIATALRAGQSEVRIPLGARDFSLLQKSRQSLAPTRGKRLFCSPKVQTVPGAH